MKPTKLFRLRAASIMQPAKLRELGIELRRDNDRAAQRTVSARHHCPSWCELPVITLFYTQDDSLPRPDFRENERLHISGLPPLQRTPVAVVGADTTSTGDGGCLEPIPLLYFGSSSVSLVLLATACCPKLSILASGG